MTIEFRSDVTVELIQSCGNDSVLAAAARVSTIGAAAAIPDGEKLGLIRFLMRDRHGSPFEHSSMTFMVEAPIAVIRDWFRHRAGWSYSEESGRYKQLRPIFYLPSPERKFVQVGKAGAYQFEAGSAHQYSNLIERLRTSYTASYEAYLESLNDGIAREMSRYVLPVGIYSSFFATCNPRSLMHFLSLRTIDPMSKFPSFPMREIEMCAEKMEAHFAKLFPVTHLAFNEFGRVAP